MDTATTSINPERELPHNFYLEQNYPNPFNPSTTIKYSIPKQSNVKIKVFDILGREVITLLNDNKIAGNYSLTFDGSDLSTGIYFYQIRTGNFTQTKKMIILR